MSKNFEKVKTYYDKGYWSARQVCDAVVKGRITENEYREITGSDPDSEEV